MERAYITQILDDFHARVRIPSINKSESANGATPAKELYVAVVSTPHGVFPKLAVGDVVVVDFEMDDISLPVIVGVLFNNVSKSKTKSNFSGINLNVDSSAVLPYNTRVGKVEPDSIKCLESLTVNVQSEFDLIHNSIEDIEESIATLEGRIKTAEESIEYIEDNYVTVTRLNEVIGTGEGSGTFDVSKSYKVEDLTISKVHNTLVSHAKDRGQHVDKEKISNWTPPTEYTEVAKHEHSINQLYGIRFGTVDPTDSNNSIKGVVDGELYFLIKEE